MTRSYGRKTITSSCPQGLTNENYRRHRNAPRIRWKDVVCMDLKELEVTADGTQDRALWQSRSRTANSANVRKKTEEEATTQSINRWFSIRRIMLFSCILRWHIYQRQQSYKIQKTTAGNITLQDNTYDEAKLDVKQTFN
ncbi:hypothetical protein Y032_0120g927 [Ancylostoma ceylanicum]|uniref:Uncharacterized protein n=1 Tax=Ancylostoma ceylanicum TaxID=53326 RepID=A0A016TAV7_9BILA|nr:hypothetical protein Y032_0120g927 [Ancylostoma ceylanicum]